MTTIKKKEPIIGNDFAEFWNEILIEYYGNLNENERIENGKKNV